MRFSILNCLVFSLELANYSSIVQKRLHYLDSVNCIAYKWLNFILFLDVLTCRSCYSSFTFMCKSETLKSVNFTFLP